MLIEIGLSKLERGLREEKVKVTRGGKTFYRRQRVGQKEKEVGEKPKKELAIMGLNKPEKEDFAHKVKPGDWVNLAGRMVKVKSVDAKNQKVTLGTKGSFIPDETYSFERLNEIGTHESSEGKFKEEKPTPRPTPREKPKEKPMEKPKEKPEEKPKEKPKGWLKPQYKVVSGKKLEPEKFAHTLKVGDWVNLAGRMVRVLSVNTKGKKVSLGTKGSFIPPESYDFDEVDAKGRPESPKGKFKKIEINLIDIFEDAHKRDRDRR